MWSSRIPKAEQGFLGPDGKALHRLLPGQLPQSSRISPLPRALWLGGHGHGPVITPAEATVVMRALWRARERAGAQDNAPMLARLETGAARDWNLEQTREGLSGFGRSARIVRRITDSVLAVPRQLRFPAYFLAVVGTRTYPTPVNPVERPYVELMVASRSSAHEPWKVAIDTGMAGTPLSDLQFISDPTDDPLHPNYNLPAPHPRWMPARPAPAALAAYYQHWFDHHSAPARSRFLGGTATTVRGRSIARPPMTGQIRHLRYYARPARDGIFQFSFSGGRWNLTCSAVRGHDDESVAEPSTMAFYQPPDRSGWPATIAPGSYSRMSWDFVHQSCLAIGPTPRDGIAALGSEGEETRVHAVRSHTVPVPKPAPVKPGILRLRFPPTTHKTS